MTTQARQEEADRVELVYQYALAHIGAASIAELMDEWNNLPAKKSAAVAGRWLTHVSRAILYRRSRAQELALSYYRLVRALRTGRTIVDPLRDPEPEYVSLEMLRKEFDLLVDEVLPQEPALEAGDEEGAHDQPEVEQERERSLDDYWSERESIEEEELDPTPLDDEDAILTEVIEGLDELLEEDAKRSEDYLTEVIEAYEESLQEGVDSIDPDAPNKDAEGERDRLKLIHGSQEAASGALVSMNGARNAVLQIAGRDDRVKGYVRQSSTGTPCYFCAMLISRGVLYSSKESAGHGRMDDFHPNCYCVVVPVFDVDHLTQSPAFEMNKYYRQLWAEHIEGKHSGEDAVNAWRRLLRRMRASTTTAEAPEAS